MATANKSENPPASPADAVKVRVLLAHGAHLPNHVINLPADEVKAAVEEGWADDNPRAVAYAEEHEPQPKAEAEG